MQLQSHALIFVSGYKAVSYLKSYDPLTALIPGLLTERNKDGRKKGMNC